MNKKRNKNHNKIKVILKTFTKNMKKQGVIEQDIKIRKTSEKKVCILYSSEVNLLRTANKLIIVSFQAQNTCEGIVEKSDWG